MRRVCVDASLALKWVTAEPAWEPANALLAEWQAQAEIYAPDHFWIECTNALRKKVAADVLSAAEAAEVLDALASIRIQPVSTRLLSPRSLEIALATDLTVWDTAYVAVAEHVDAELWTADRELAAKGRRVLPAICLLWDAAPERTR